MPAFGVVLDHTKPMEIDGPKTMFSLEGTIPKHNDLKTYDLVQSGHVGLCTCPLRKRKNDVKAHD